MLSRLSRSLRFPFYASPIVRSVGGDIPAIRPCKAYLPVDSCRKLRNLNRLPNQAISPSTKGVKVAIMSVRGEGRADGTHIPRAADRSSARDRASALNRHCWLFEAAGKRAG